MNLYKKSFYLDYNDLKILEQKLSTYKIPEKDKKIVDIFIESFKKIKELLILFNELSSKVYLETIYIKIYFYNYEIICQINEEIMELNEILVYYKSIKKALKLTWDL